MHQPRLRRTGWVFLLALSGVGCGDPHSGSVGYEGGAKGCNRPPYSSDCVRELDNRASSGDSQAARDLALHRFWDLEKRDRKTLRLLRLWARNDPGGLPLLSIVLSDSCDKADRVEAIARLEEFMESKEFRTLDKYAQASSRETLARLKGTVETRPEKCDDLEKEAG